MKPSYIHLPEDQRPIEEVEQHYQLTNYEGIVTKLLPHILNTRLP